jgi:hypothetical protein
MANVKMVLTQGNFKKICPPDNARLNLMLRKHVHDVHASIIATQHPMATYMRLHSGASSNDGL